MRVYHQRSRGFRNYNEDIYNVHSFIVDLWIPTVNQTVRRMCRISKEQARSLVKKGFALVSNSQNIYLKDKNDHEKVLKELGIGGRKM